MPLSLLGLAGLLAVNLWSYTRLTGEVDLGAIAFSEIGEQRYMAHFLPLNGPAEDYTLAGDQWQLGVRLIKWQSWLSVLGRDPLYRLDRLSGRYQDIEQARDAERTVYDLNEEHGIDLFSLVMSADGSWIGVDAKYGASVYLPMRNKARYVIKLSGSGLIARPDNRAAESAVSNW